MNARDASRLGLGTLTHYYGLFESLLKDYTVQPFPVNQNYNDEQHRFGQVARLHDKIHPRGSEQWNALIKEWVDAKFMIDPTMTIYSAGRDVMRMRNADWHEQVHAAVTVGLLPAQSQRARLVLVQLDDGRRDPVEEVLPGVDVVPERLQERRRPRHDRVRLRLHLPDLRLRLHPRARDAAGSGLPSARGHPVRDAATARRRCTSPRASRSTSASSGRACSPTWSSSIRTRSRTSRCSTPPARSSSTIRTVRPRVGGIKYTIKDGIVYDAKKLAAEVAAHRRAREARRRPQQDNSKR